MKTSTCILLIVLTLLKGYQLSAQIAIQRAIHYEQITAFDTNTFISSMKISGDASVIVFGTSGTAVKVFTMGIDGSNLTEVYDFERTGSGVNVDISVSGNKIMWCDGYGEIFVANNDGSDLAEIATQLPDPDGGVDDITPTFPVPPRINALGTQVFFMTGERDARASGLWRVDADGSDLTQVFDYYEMASEVFEADGSEYNYNTAFTDGFDISSDGSYVIFGTRIFQLQDGQLEKGDAIVHHAGDFTLLSDYATGTQPFATYPDGDHYMFFRGEINPTIQAEEISLYAKHYGGSAETKIIAGLGIFSYPQMVQLTSTGDQGIVLAGGGVPYTPPITYVSSLPNYFFDLVNIDDISIAFGGYRISYSRLPSISLSSEYFCFIAPSTPEQVWVGHITSSSVDEDPSISNVLLEKDEILQDGSTTTHIEAEVHTWHGEIEKVAVTEFLDGAYQFRGLTSDYPVRELVNDQTLGDTDSTDYFFTNNTIRADINAQLGDYTFRIAAGNSTLREITAADFHPLRIVEELSQNPVEEHAASPITFHVWPNLMQGKTEINFNVFEPSGIRIDLLDIYGRSMELVVDSHFGAGEYNVEWENDYLLQGIYYMRLQSARETIVQKLVFVR